MVAGLDAYAKQWHLYLGRLHLRFDVVFFNSRVSVRQFIHYRVIDFQIEAPRAAGRSAPNNEIAETASQAGKRAYATARVRASNPMSVLLQRSSHPEPKATGFVDNMRAALRSSTHRRRSSSISTVPPPRSSSDYSSEHAAIAASILYRSPLPSQSGLPIYILNAAAFPDAYEVDYDTLLAYVLARLPGEEELIAGEDYEIVFFAGGQPDSATSEKKTGPGLGWYLQTYHVLSRAIRKRLAKLYVVHERSWVRVLIEVFGTIVSPKFKKKIIHVNTLSGLALHMPIEQLLIPPSVYLHDRRIAQDIYAPYVSGRRAFGAYEPLPRYPDGTIRLPRILRETTTFLCHGDHLKTEGLFRIPPHSQLLSILREAYDRGQNFIVWKEGSVVWAQPGMDPSILREVHQADTYNVHLAAGMIKLWYRELKEPIFDESCYVEARRRFGDIEKDLTVDDLADIVSPSSTTSFLSSSARLIATLHLLPLLSLVASHEPANRMTPENLAICFAPTLVCGSDQLADAKMTSIVRRFLEAAIQAWPKGLREACNIAPDAFAAAISPPADPQHYEDPLHEGFRPNHRNNVQDEARRALLDQYSDSDRPALPPRPRTSSKNVFPARQDSLATHVKRKPAPPPSILPQYSAAAPVAPVAPKLSKPPVDTGDLLSFDNVDEKKQNKAEEKSTSPQSAQPKAAQASQAAPATKGDFMQELRASLTTDMVRRKPISSPISPPSPIFELPGKVNASQQRSVSGDAPLTESKDSVFARPTWAASSRQVSAPVMVEAQPSSATSTRSTPAAFTSSANLAAPAPAFKVRSPSPGLLKRMASMDGEKDKDKDKILPRRLGLKQASVDDLRRLYEERAGAVAQLTTTSANASRRGSNVSMIGSRRNSNVSAM